ncbi:hypothetical protein FNH05_37700, partial [Amycolatopsis rhizosphaerae]
MTQQNAAKRRGTARAARWLSRALLAVGGAVAGTAAAWAIGSATASADTALPSQDSSATVSVTPVTDATVGVGDDVVGGLSGLVGQAATTRFDTPDLTATMTRGDQQVARQITGAVHDFTRQAVLHPAERILGALEQISRQPQDTPRVLGEALTPPPGLFDFLRPPAGLITLPGLPLGQVTGDRTTVAGTEPGADPAEAPSEAGVPASAVVPAAAGHADPADTAYLAYPPAIGYDQQERHHGERSAQVPPAPKRAPMAPSG